MLIPSVDMGGSKSESAISKLCAEKLRFVLSGRECWSVGGMEKWSVGVMEDWISLHYSSVAKGGWGVVIIAIVQGSGFNVHFLSFFFDQTGRFVAS